MESENKSLLILVAVVAALAIWSFPLIQVSYTVSVPYEVIYTFQESKPYKESVTKYRTETRTEKVVEYEERVEKSYPLAVTQIPGTVFDGSAYYKDGYVIPMNEYRYLVPVETYRKYSVEVPYTEEITKYREVTRREVVTQHRYELRYKKVSIFDYLMHY